MLGAEGRTGQDRAGQGQDRVRTHCRLAGMMERSKERKDQQSRDICLAMEAPEQCSFTQGRPHCRWPTLLMPMPWVYESGKLGRHYGEV